MKVNVKIPKSIQNYTQTADYLTQAFRTGIIKDTAQGLSQAGGDVRIQSGRITATIGKLSDRGVIDLKPFFRNSSKVKRKKNGGWYMVIPIGISSRNLQATSGRKTYDKIREVFSSLGPNETATANFEDLFSHSSTMLQTMTLPSLIPASPTGNLTATKSQSGTRTSYVAYRTVSDRSAPQSWVINRKNINEANSSLTLQHEVGVLIRQRIKQGADG